MSTGVRGRDNITDLLGREKRWLWEEEPLTELDVVEPSVPCYTHQPAVLKSHAPRTAPAAHPGPSVPAFDWLEQLLFRTRAK